MGEKVGLDCKEPGCYSNARVFKLCVQAQNLIMYCTGTIIDH